MAVTTQRQLALQMVRQLRILDPSASAEIGTPERKMIDTFAQGLADAQVDVAALEASLNLDSKFGDTLDQFLSIFSFGRQRGTASIGIVEFSRVTPSNLDIIIPSGSQVTAINPDGSAQAVFRTTQGALLAAGELLTLAPVRSVQVGASTNVAANTITSFGPTVISGITGITNPNPTSGGSDAESDAAYKVRFKNTYFRNLAGTSDQYLALAVAGAFTNKANVIGPISRYREYIQVPATDDLVGGNGSAGEYTSALSTIPYSQHTYDSVPSFVSNGQSGLGAVFYTEGIDFDLNAPAVNKGDTYRQVNAGTGLAVTDPDAEFRPNVTFLNVYADNDQAVDSIRTEDIVLFEHSYISTASRNDYDRAILNCVDVYVNNENATAATTVIPRPKPGALPFQDNPTHRLHFENYRRVGEPEHRPVLGNLFSPLFWNPLLTLPSQLVIDNFTYLQGYHYWPVIDVSEQGGTVRARTGIEWSADAAGLVGVDFAGPTITANDATSIKIANYTYDKNINDLQGALEGSKQTTTDVLVHKAILRFFKFDITVMFAPGNSITNTGPSIVAAVQSFLENIYFGSVIQLSDILQVIHSVAGVDNVRWTNALSPGVIETDINGNPRLGGIVDRSVIGDESTGEIQTFYLTDEPTGGTYQIQTVEGQVTGPIPYNASFATVNTALSTLINPTVTCTAGSGTPTDPFIVEFPTGIRDLITIIPDFAGGSTVFNSDFFLKDDEQATLPTGTIEGDTVPGFIIRARAQNTFADA
jgi:uncharacterized phage protein gp47/JayE